MLPLCRSNITNSSGYTLIQPCSTHWKGPDGITNEINWGALALHYNFQGRLVHVVRLLMMIMDNLFPHFQGKLVWAFCRLLLHGIQQWWFLMPEIFTALLNLSSNNFLTLYCFRDIKNLNNLSILAGPFKQVKYHEGMLVSCFQEGCFGCQPLDGATIRVKRGPAMVCCKKFLSACR